MPLYHYTDRLSAAEILAAGVIRAQPMTLHRDVLRRDQGYTTPPIVWLSTEPVLDGTVRAKLLAAGWPRRLHGHVFRFLIGDDVPAAALDDYSRAAGIDVAWWEWAIRTASFAGSQWRTWRLVDRDISRQEWLCVQVQTATGLWEQV